MNRVAARCLAMLLPGLLHGQSPPQFAVAPRPLTVIGAVDAPENEQVTNVTGVRRLSDGRVVVANGKPLELRIYSPQGKFMSRIGRKGSGPGEFQGRLDLLAAGGDSILVWDQSNLRLILFSTDGKLVREWTSSDEKGSPRGQTVLYHRALAQGMTVQQSACAKQLLDALAPLPPPGVRELYPDGTGRFWGHVDPANSWTLYTPDGRVVGGVQLPKGLQVYQVGDKFVVGKVLLEDDIEQLRVISIATPNLPSRPACMSRVDSFPAPPSSPRMLELKAVLRSSMTAQEMYFSNYATYAPSEDSLKEVKARLPAGILFRVLTANATGYGAFVFDARSTLACAFRAGRSSGLIGWPDMAVRCTT